MRIAATLSLLLVLTGCGRFFGECITASVSGTVQNQDGAPIDGAEVSQCAWEDCQSLRVVAVTDAQGSFQAEVDMRKTTFGGCEASWIRVAATGCTPQELPGEQFNAPIVLDCAGR